MTLRAPAGHPFADLPDPIADARRAIDAAGLTDPAELGRIIAASLRADRALDRRRRALHVTAAAAHRVRRAAQRQA